MMSLETDLIADRDTPVFIAIDMDAQVRVREGVCGKIQLTLKSEDGAGL